VSSRSTAVLRSPVSEVAISSKGASHQPHDSMIGFDWGLDEGGSAFDFFEL
jgi:hypothetical protein